MGDTFKNPYDILEIPHASDFADVKKAWKELSFKYHPDRPDGDENRMKEINAAYEILKDPEQKRKLDEPNNSTFDDDEYQDFNSTQRSNQPSDNYPFWGFDEKGKLHIRYKKLCYFLEESGFGNFSDDGDITKDTVHIRSVDGYVQVHNAKTVKKFLIEFVNNDVSILEGSKEGVLDFLIKLPTSTLNTYLESLSVSSLKSNEDCDLLDILFDNKEECFIPFKNGVVKITKDDIQLLSKDALKDDGKMWASSVIPHSIDLSSFKLDVDNNYFRKFVIYALKKGINPKIDENDLHEGTDTDEHKNSMDALETAYGSMLHTYVHPTQSRGVIFIDAGAFSNVANGGNGKSVVMKSVEHFKNTVEVDGKGWKTDKSFTLSSVKRDTQFVIISDIRSTFEYELLFNHVTDEFSVEGKGTNSWSFSKDKKPKLGITTNYIPDGKGTSFSRRFFIIEFGDFFKRGIEQKPVVAPDDVMGLILFDDFTEDDWNTFFNYGFHCIQRYLKEGLIPQESTDLALKILIKQTEGKGGDGVLTKWLRDWIADDRVKGNYHKNGIPIKDFWGLFAKDHPSHADREWKQPQFKKALFDYVDHVKELEYNPHLASKGNSMSDRKWRKGEREKQVEWVKITHIDDDQSDDDDEILKIFEQLAA